MAQLGPSRVLEGVDLPPRRLESVALTPYSFNGTGRHFLFSTYNHPAATWLASTRFSPSQGPFLVDILHLIYINIILFLNTAVFSIISARG